MDNKKEIIKKNIELEIDKINENNDFNKNNNSKIKQFFKYLFLIVLSLIIAKWIIFFLPSNQQIKSTTTQTTKPIQHEKLKEVTLSVNYDEIKPQIQKEYELAKDDIYNYINEEINAQKENSFYYLSESDDNFLDWIFGWGTGWEMVLKKAKGLFGSEDNEIKLVTSTFQEMVIEPGLDTMYQNINDYTKNRIEDYYKSVIEITTNYINSKIKKLKQEGYTNIQIDTSTIPWGQYIVNRGGDILTLTEATGVTGIGLVVGKVVGSKIASILGPKMIGIVEAKTASIIAGKIASAFELFLMPILDYAANEAVRAVKYDETKAEFEDVIDTIYSQIKLDLENNVDYSLNKVRNSIYEELNKQTIIKAKGD